MPEAKWVGYSAGAVWIGTAYSGSTSLSALANGSWATSGATLIDNSTNLKLYCDIEVVLASAVTAGSGAPNVSVYLIPAPDGTNLATPPGSSAAAAPGIYFVGNILANASASFTRGTLRGVVLPPGKFALLIQNNLGVAFPTSSSNTVTGYTYGEQA